MPSKDAVLLQQVNCANVKIESQVEFVTNVRIYFGICNRATHLDAKIVVVNGKEQFQQLVIAMVKLDNVFAKKTWNQETAKSVEMAHLDSWREIYSVVLTALVTSAELFRKQLVTRLLAPVSAAHSLPEESAMNP